jgi:hypothetical protein
MSASATITLDRDDLVQGLREVVAELHRLGQPAGIRIVGGAALALRYFDRRTTSDIDAVVHPPGSTLEAVSRVADSHGWPHDWLNGDVVGFLPLGGPAEWETLYADDIVSISVASAQMLLAMKLNAGRSGRDGADIRNLLAICAVETVGEAEQVFDLYYPGEVMSARAESLLMSIIENGEHRAVPVSPPLPRFGSGGEGQKMRGSD